MVHPLSEDIELSMELETCVECGRPVDCWGQDYCRQCWNRLLEEAVLVTPPVCRDNPLRPVPTDML